MQNEAKIVSVMKQKLLFFMQKYAKILSKEK